MYTVSGPEEDADAGQTMRGIVGGTKLFNRFTLQKVLGRGGMGVVWLARDERLDRLVALKLVPEAVCFDASAQEDLKRETRKSLLLTHPNIVRIFDFIEDEDSAAICMEYVDGSTLSSLRVKKPSKCFEVDEIAPWITSLCDALTYAHESAHLVHRDLKPANLMINSRGDLKITDFGIACTLRDSMSCVSARTSSGTLNYMSPQQLLGQDPSPADDIYAVGATLYEMLSSKPPFFGGDIASQVREIIAPTIALRRAKFGINGASIPKYWEETIAACLAKEPEQRPRAPADVARRLRLGGTVRLGKPEPDTNIDMANTLAYLRDKLRVINPQMAALAGGLMALVAAMVVVFHHPTPNAPAVVSAPTQITAPGAATVADPPRRIKPRAAAPVLGYALEKPGKIGAAIPLVPPAPPAPPAPAPSAPPMEAATVEPITIAEEPEDTAPALPHPLARNATLELTTAPPGSSFAIYSGVVAGKSIPLTAPLRTGKAPVSIPDLPPGRYTLVFHNEGWPDDRAEISVNAGELVPVNYTFPHGTATIASTPDGAEILLGPRSLGKTPLNVDLPLGKQKLVARLPDLPERSEIVTIEPATPAAVNFQMTARKRSSSRPMATPTPTALNKIGDSFKHLFGGSRSRTPAPRKKR